MPDKYEPRLPVSTDICWLTGESSEVEPLSTSGASLRRYRIRSESEARAIARALARSFSGVAIVEASCPGFAAACQILGRSPAIRLVTLHPTFHCMDALTLPPPALSL